MAIAHGKSAKIMVNGRDLSSYLRSVNVEATADVVEVSTFGSSAKSYVAGLQDGTLTAEGIYDPVASVGSDAVLRAALGGDLGPHEWTVYPQNDTFGNVGYGLGATGTKFSIETPISDVVSVSAEAQSSTGSEPQLSHQALALIAAPFNGTGIDNTAASANGGTGYLQVSAATALTTATIKIQDSVDNVTFTDLITFVAVTAAPNSQRIALAVGSAVKRYTRCAVTTLTGTNITFQASFGRK